MFGYIAIGYAFNLIPDLVANYPKHALHSLQIKDVIWIPDMGSGITPLWNVAGRVYRYGGDGNSA
ncbi:MAG: hypothetical protein LBT90_03085 [Holosporaceae bacterium]|nr:hypothetical protein [Holosporaceae bacterium]